MSLEQGWCYLGKDGQAKGPIPLQELRALLKSGTVTLTTKVHHKFFSSWRLLDRVLSGEEQEGTGAKNAASAAQYFAAGASKTADGGAQTAVAQAARKLFQGLDGSQLSRSASKGTGKETNVEVLGRASITAPTSHVQPGNSTHEASKVGQKRPLALVVDTELDSALLGIQPSDDEDDLPLGNKITGRNPSAAAFKPPPSSQQVAAPKPRTVGNAANVLAKIGGPKQKQQKLPAPTPKASDAPATAAYVGNGAAQAYSLLPSATAKAVTGGTAAATNGVGSSPHGICGDMVMVDSSESSDVFADDVLAPSPPKQEQYSDADDILIGMPSTQVQAAVQGSGLHALGAGAERMGTSGGITSGPSSKQQTQQQQRPNTQTNAQRPSQGKGQGQPLNPASKPTTAAASAATTAAKAVVAKVCSRPAMPASLPSGASGGAGAGGAAAKEGTAAFQPAHAAGPLHSTAKPGAAPAATAARSTSSAKPPAAAQPAKQPGSAAQNPRTQLGEARPPVQSATAQASAKGAGTAAAKPMQASMARAGELRTAAASGAAHGLGGRSAIAQGPMVRAGTSTGAGAGAGQGQAGAQGVARPLPTNTGNRPGTGVGRNRPPSAARPAGTAAATPMAAAAAPAVGTSRARTLAGSRRGAPTGTTATRPVGSANGYGTSTGSSNAAGGVAGGSGGLLSQLMGGSRAPGPSKPAGIPWCKVWAGLPELAKGHMPMLQRDTYSYRVGPEGKRVEISGLTLMQLRERLERDELPEGDKTLVTDYDDDTSLLLKTLLETAAENFAKLEARHLGKNYRPVFDTHTTGTNSSGRLYDGPRAEGSGQKASGDQAPPAATSSGYQSVDRVAGNGLGVRPGSSGGYGPTATQSNAIGRPKHPSSAGAAASPAEGSSGYQPVSHGYGPGSKHQSKRLHAQQPPIQVDDLHGFDDYIGGHGHEDPHVYNPEIEYDDDPAPLHKPASPFHQAASPFHAAPRSPFHRAMPTSPYIHAPVSPHVHLGLTSPYHALKSPRHAELTEAVIHLHPVSPHRRQSMSGGYDLDPHAYSPGMAMLAGAMSTPACDSFMQQPLPPVSPGRRLGSASSYPPLPSQPAAHQPMAHQHMHAGHGRSMQGNAGYDPMDQHSGWGANMSRSGSLPDNQARPEGHGQQRGSILGHQAIEQQQQQVQQQRQQNWHQQQQEMQPWQQQQQQQQPAGLVSMPSMSHPPPPPPPPPPLVPLQPQQQIQQPQLVDQQQQPLLLALPDPTQPVQLQLPIRQPGAISIPGVGNNMIEKPPSHGTLLQPHQQQLHQQQGQQQQQSALQYQGQGPGVALLLPAQAGTQQAPAPGSDRPVILSLPGAHPTVPIPSSAAVHALTSGQAMAQHAQAFSHAALPAAPPAPPASSPTAPTTSAVRTGVQITVPTNEEGLVDVNNVQALIQQLQSLVGAQPGTHSVGQQAAAAAQQLPKLPAQPAPKLPYIKKEEPQQGGGGGFEALAPSVAAPAHTFVPASAPETALAHDIELIDLTETVIADLPAAAAAHIASTGAGAVVFRVLPLNSFRVEKPYLPVAVTHGSQEGRPMRMRIHRISDDGGAADDVIELTEEEEQQQQQQHAHHQEGQGAGLHAATGGSGAYHNANMQHVTVQDIRSLLAGLQAPFAEAQAAA